MPQSRTSLRMIFDRAFDRRARKGSRLAAVRHCDRTGLSVIPGVVFQAAALDYRDATPAAVGPSGLDFHSGIAVVFVGGCNRPDGGGGGCVPWRIFSRAICFDVTGRLNGP